MGGSPLGSGGRPGLAQPPGPASGGPRFAREAGPAGKIKFRRAFSGELEKSSRRLLPPARFGSRAAAARPRPARWRPDSRAKPPGPRASARLLGSTAAAVLRTHGRLRRQVVARAGLGSACRRSKCADPRRRALGRILLCDGG